MALVKQPKTAGFRPKSSKMSDSNSDLPKISDHSKISYT